MHLAVENAMHAEAFATDRARPVERAHGFGTAGAAGDMETAGRAMHLLIRIPRD